MELVQRVLRGLTVVVKVVHCLNYEADHRTSMEVYADALANGLTDGNHSGLELSRFRPESNFAKYPDSRWAMRVARYWTYPRQIKRMRADVYHIVDHGYAHLTAALDHRPKIVTVHDLIPLLRWKRKIDGQEPAPRPWLSEYSVSKLVHADRVITVSESTKRDLLEHTDVPEHKIRVIHLGVDPAFRPLPEDTVSAFKASIGWDEQQPIRRILITGDQFYKNHKTSVQVFKQLKSRCRFRLRLVNSRARRGSLMRLAGRVGLTDSDIDEIYVRRHSDMPLLLNSVDCLLFPSLYEGFGMPVLEALACGTPVVCSNRGSLPEIANGLTNLHDAHDVDGMADDLLAILQSQDAHPRVERARTAIMKKFSWHDTARRTFEEYRRASQAA